MHETQVIRACVPLKKVIGMIGRLRCGERGCYRCYNGVSDGTIE